MLHRDELPADAARKRLELVWALPIRLLGDAVLHRRAWELAEQLGRAETYEAAYVARTWPAGCEASSPAATIDALPTAGAHRPGGTCPGV